MSEHEHRYEGRGRDDITVWDCSCGDTMGAALERTNAGRSLSSNEEAAMSGDCHEDVSYWPRGVMDPLCPSEHVIAESMDRRVLWHLENQLAVSATTDYLKDVQRNLSKYLHQTCAHHWHDDVGYEDQPPLRQCLWCNAVEDMA